MKLKMEQTKYAEWRHKNSDPYGGQVFVFLEEWAHNMEEKIAEGKQVADIAGECEPKGHDMTGFMYGCAVNILSQAWEHGEDLRRWHNLKWQLHDEGEKANEKGTVLNPALISFSAKE